MDVDDGLRVDARSPTRVDTRTITSDLVCGSLTPPVCPWQTKRPCNIIAEHWPSCFSICLHFPSYFLSIAIHCPGLLSSTTQVCRTHFGTWTWSSCVPTTISDAAICLFQGTRQFLLDLPEAIVTACTAVFSDHEPTAGQRLPVRAGWKGAGYCFSDYGGVISSRSLIKDISDDRVFCCAVRHLTLMRGWDVRGYLNKGYVFEDRVLCPSVYGSSKWVSRPVTPKELAAIYHLSTILHKEADRSWGFHQAAPGILLKYVWENIINPISPPLGPNQLLSTRVESAFRQKSAVLDRKDVKLDRKPVEPIPSCRNSGPKVEASFNFSTAVKAGDAETPTFIWDDRVWGLNLHCTQQREHFYNRFEGRDPLCAIRKMLLMYWRKCLTRSYIQYMQGCHGEKWASCRKADKERQAGRDCL